MGVNEQIERIYRSMVAQIQAKKAASIAVVLAAAAAAIFAIHEVSDREMECAAYARDAMHQFMSTKTIGELHYTFAELKGMQTGYYQECMSR